MYAYHHGALGVCKALEGSLTVWQTCCSNLVAPLAQTAMLAVKRPDVIRHAD